MAPQHHTTLGNTIPHFYSTSCRSTSTIQHRAGRSPEAVFTANLAPEAELPRQAAVLTLARRAPGDAAGRAGG